MVNFVENYLLNYFITIVQMGDIKTVLHLLFFQIAKNAKLNKSKEKKHLNVFNAKIIMPFFIVIHWIFLVC